MEKVFKSQIGFFIPTFALIITLSFNLSILVAQEKGSLDDKLKRIEKNAMKESKGASGIKSKGAAMDKAKKMGISALSILSQIESDLLIFGLFPNSEGFMDGKLHLRNRYLGSFSSGIYFDYLTTKKSQKSGTKFKQDTLTKEYRLESDVIKGIWVPIKSSSLIVSLEPAATFNLILRDIEASGYLKNPDGSVVFNSDLKNTTFLGAGIKLQSTIKAGSMFLFDLDAEYIPLAYNNESGEKFTSQFPDEPIKSDLTNITAGFQGSVKVLLDLDTIGKFSLMGKIFRNFGEIKSEAIVINGNYKTTVQTYSKFHEDFYWLDLSYHIVMLKGIVGATPIVSLIYQFNETEIASEKLSSTIFKIGFMGKFF